jgi:selenide, water dikinase
MYENALTTLSRMGGCAAKIEAATLQKILAGLKIDPVDEHMIVDHEDVGLASLSPSEQLAQSIDMITPVSDNPKVFGAIAASHALNDLYAKGACPISGLLILELPALLVSAETAIDILQGAIDKLHEAGAKFLGGHTIESQELQLGLAVTGLIKDEIIPNAGCKKGDLLVLTKPLGTGITITALKLKNVGIDIDNFSDETVLLSEQNMLSLNEVPSQVMRQIKVNACTDISGFGLLGHLSEMLKPSKLSAHIYFNKVPLIPGVIELASQDILSAGGERNAAFFWANCTFANSISYAQRMLLFDPQTSGGLLMSVSQDNVDRLIKELEQRGVQAAIIGEIIQKDSAMIDIV